MKDAVQRLQQLLTLAAITLPTPSTSVQYRSLCTMVATNQQESVLQSTENEVETGFMKGDGPFVRGLEAALESFNVRRQAYLL